jgi:nucleoid-associated protein YgaU
MRDFRLSLALGLVAAFSLPGCANLPAGASAPSQRSSDTMVKEGSTATAESEKTTEPAAGKAEAVAASADSEPAVSPAVAHEPNATPTERLVEQLNDATRELATLRASNAKFRASAAKPPAPVVVREPDPADVKLTASFRSYAQFKQELTGFFADLDKLRSENAAMSAELKDATASSKEARAALAKLEGELQSEKDAHGQAEQTVTKLREQLRAVADAVAAAGLSLDKAPSSAEPTARLETSQARLRAVTTRQHTVKDGDTLETLADRYYGDATKWKLILDANRGRLPLDGAMPAGLELDIPAK